MPEFVKVARAGEIKSGDAKVVEVNGKKYALFNVEGRYHCLDNTCPHRGGPLGEGFLDGTTVTCPWHGWQFDAASGEGKTKPGTSLARFEVKVEGDDIYIGV